MTVTPRVLFVLSLLFVAGCTGDGSPEPDSAASATEGSATAQSDPGPTAADDSAATETTGTEITATSTPSTARAGSVLEPGDIGAFASPSGNILCLMSESTASCWISEKNWTIDQPDAPECAESDWGNVIDVSAEGVYWPCYTDFGFDPDAASLAYGDAMVVGGFRCDSARTGVTCRNRSGRGFTLARAEVQVF